MTVFWIAIVFVLLVFPNGRLDGTLNRWLLAGAVLMLPLDLAWFMAGLRVPSNWHRWGDPEQWSSVHGTHRRCAYLQRVETGLEVVLLMPLVIVAVARTCSSTTPRVPVADRADLLDRLQDSPSCS